MKENVLEYNGKGQRIYLINPKGIKRNSNTVRFEQD